MLQHVSDAAIGPNASELEFERRPGSKLYFMFPALFLSPTSGGKERS
jgi:hypothetical protein